MKTASPNLFIPILKSQIKEYFAANSNERKDTNIGLISFSFLKDGTKAALNPADITLCSGCGAALNFSSHISEEYDEDRNSQDFIWKCEFCNHKNSVDISENEKIKKSDPLFSVQKEMVKNENKNVLEMKEEIREADNDPVLIFCLDTSGSMCQKAGKNHVSRTKCVTSAIKSTLVELKEKQPNRKVGIVTFNSEIHALGDGFGEPKSFPSSLDFDSCINLGKACSESLLKHSLKDSFPKIQKKLDEIEENGSTALGPALLLAVGIASQCQMGGSIILCTDGLANRGEGSLANNDDHEKAREYYNKIAYFANQHAIMINITTIKGDECKIDVLGSLTDSTDGKIVRVNPDEIEGNFQEMIKEEILASKVEIKLLMPKALTLRHFAECEFKQMTDYMYSKIMGNITEKSEIIFEYDLKPEEDEEKLRYYSKELKGFPIQTQISFHTPEGAFLKIITIFQKISNEKEEVEEKASVAIIKKASTKKTCIMAIKQKKIFDSGDYYRIAEKSSKCSDKKEDQDELEEFKKEAQHIENILTLKKTESSKKKPMISDHYKKPFDSADFYLDRKKGNSQQWAPPLQAIPEIKLSQDFEMSDELAMKLMNIKNHGIKE